MGIEIISPLLDLTDLGIIDSFIDLPVLMDVLE